MTTTKRKMTIYVPEEVAKQIEAESARVERNTSWIVEYAWRVAHKRVQLVPRAAMPVDKQTSKEETEQS